MAKPLNRARVVEALLSEAAIADRPGQTVRLEALATAIEAWCVVEGGHRWRRELSERPQDCANCGQRRADTEGGR